MTDAALPTTPPRPSPARPPRLRLQIHDDPGRIDAAAWDALLAASPAPTPFLRHAFLAALHASGSACAATGWQPVFMTLADENDADVLRAGAALYLKSHSYGEYVFDWAWADAWERAGQRYYPKLLGAVPFTPVPGSRLLARDAAARAALVRALIDRCGQKKLSSLHVLFGDATDRAACDDAGLMQRNQVQFHWQNTHPSTGAPFTDFNDFLASLTQEKRKKIRQERRKVMDAGVRFRWARGADITPQDWDFFYRCYERTYLEHGNPPYLTPDFFQRLAHHEPEPWVLFNAERAGEPIATSLIATGAQPTSAAGQNGMETVAYGRYWGATQRVDCLHFDACYYQPLQWCMAHGVQRFEGGAQGEHKMARALLPVRTHSAHWLAHPAFADAVDRFLAQERLGVDQYLQELWRHSPLKN